MSNLFKTQQYRFIFRYIVLPFTLFCLVGCRTMTDSEAVSTSASLPVTLEVATLTPEVTNTMPLRVTIEVATLMPQVTATPSPQITIEVTTLTPAAQQSGDAAFAYLHAAVKDNMLLDSYATTATFDDGDTAWIYDNALVLLTFLARGTPEDLEAARHLADAFVYAQTHDPDFDDGRLRDAYHAHTFIRDDGTVHVDRSGSASGNMAWVTLALLEAWELLGDEAYLTAAQRLGQWIFNHTYNKRGAGGYTGGLDDNGMALQWKATEHNADIYPAFMRLYQATGNDVWRERAMSAKRFLQAMWDKEQGLFWTGTTSDGETINLHPIPEDAQSWTLLALGEGEKYGRGLFWAEETLSGESCAASGTAVGYRFSNAGFGYWSEGTAHMALAWQFAKERERAESLLASLRSLQMLVSDIRGQTIPAACGTDAMTGYGWVYPEGVPHIGATAWYLMAEENYNPFWGVSTADPIPFAGIYDETPAAECLFQNGMNYASWWQGDYQQPWADESMQALAATGRNWISIIVTCYQESYTSVSIACDLPRTPTDDDLIYAIGQAHALELNVMLKPHLDLNNDPDHWRGDIGSGFTSEAEWSAWFAAYQAFIGRYARLAETEGIAQFSFGVELVGTSHREAEWRQVITAARQQFSGSLVYASNYGGEESAITWWDALDYIGVDTYYPLASHDNPPPDELRAAWEAPLASLTNLAAQYNKPIIITEIGYRSVDGATRVPWDFTAEGEVDLQEQADAYQVALESLCAQPWLTGIYWWFWSPRPEGGALDMGYTPRSKPAEAILRQQSCSGINLEPTMP